MPSKPQVVGVSLTEAVQGSRLVALIALRDRLAGDIDACSSARDVASLSQRLLDVLAQIDAEAVPTVKRTALDELAARRGATADSKPGANRGAV